MCSDLISPGHLDALSIAQESLTSLSQQTLQLWSNGTVSHLITTIRPSILMEYGVSTNSSLAIGEEYKSHSSSHFLPPEPPFKSCWKKAQVQLDAENDVGSGNGNNESLVNSPGRVSPPLINLFMAAWQRFSLSIVSVDTVQAVPEYRAMEPNGSNSELFALTCNGLIKEFANDFYVRLGRGIATVYSELAIVTDAMASQNNDVKLNNQIGRNVIILSEQRALQVILDLTLSQLLLDVDHNLEANKAIKDCKERWMDKADAVDCQLLDERLSSLATEHFRRSRFLFPFASTCTETFLKNTKATSIGLHEEVSPIAATCSSRFSLLPLPFGSHFAHSGNASSSSEINDTATLAKQQHSSSLNSINSSTKNSSSTSSFGSGLRAGALGMGLTSSLEGLRSNLTGLSTLGLGSFLQSQQS